MAGEFVDALADDFSRHGGAAIQKVRQEKPDIYIRVIASVVPRLIDASLNVDVDLHADVKSFAQAFRMAQMARDYIGADPLLIEAKAGDVLGETAETG